MMHLYAMLNIIPFQCALSLDDFVHGLISDGDKINLLVVLAILDTDIATVLPTIILPLLHFLLWLQ